MLFIGCSWVVCRVWREEEEAFLWSEGVWDPIGYPANSCFCPSVRVAVEGCPYMVGLIGVGSLRVGNSKFNERTVTKEGTHEPVKTFNTSETSGRK